MKIIRNKMDVLGVIAILLSTIVLSAVIQSLLLWFGGAFTTLPNLGIALCFALGSILLMIALAVLSIAGGGVKCVLCALIALMVIFAGTMSGDGDLLLAGAAALLGSLIYLYKVASERFLVSFAVSVFLLFVVGAYLATLFNGIDPLPEAWCIGSLVALAVGVWFVPAKEVEIEV